MLKMILAALLLSGGLAHAQAQSRDVRVQSLERKVQQLQRQNMNIEDRLQALEYGQYPPQYGGPVSAIPYSAMIVDSGSSKVFLGSGSTKLEAEAKARQECAKVVNSYYCNGTVRFAQATPGSRGAFCVVTDSGSSKTFTGRGADLIEAEAKAKQACQSTVNSYYCGNVSPRCETEQ